MKTIRKVIHYRSLLTDKIYRLLKVKKGIAFLQEAGGSSRLLTKRENLKLFYERIEGNQPGSLPFVSYVYDPKPETPFKS